VDRAIEVPISNGDQRLSSRSFDNDGDVDEDDLAVWQVGYIDDAFDGYDFLNFAT
jgi:hypothetical protein